MSENWWDNKNAWGNLYTNGGTANTNFSKWADTADFSQINDYANLSMGDKKGFMDYVNSQGTSEGFGFNNDTFNAAGSAAKGAGSMMQGWAGLQGVKLGRERLARQDQQFGANFSNQATLLNNQVNKHNRWAEANPGSTKYDQVSTDYRNI